MDWSRVREKLAAPFPAGDIEWRIGRAGTKQGGGVWAKALAYVTARAVQERLDQTVGVGGWQSEIRELADGGFLYGIGIYDDDRGLWVWKWNGAQRTDIEGTKGGISGAEKRCASAGWGIGRYLYHMTEAFVVTSETKSGACTQYAKASGTAYYWAIPQLPAWALPGGSGKPGVAAVPAATPEPEPEPKPEPAEKPDWGAMTEMGFTAYELSEGTAEALADIEAAATENDIRARFRRARHSGALSEVDKFENLRLEFAARDRIHALHTAREGAA